MKTTTVVLGIDEWLAMRFLARKHKVKVGAYLRAIVIDAIADEGLDVQRLRTQGRTPSGEGSEASGAPAT